MEHRESVPFLEANLARQLHWIAAADTKAAFAFTLITAMLGLLAAIAPRNPSAWSVATAVFTSFAVALGAAGLLFLSFASFPRTGGPKGSLIYCNGIAQRSGEQFKQAVDQLSLDAYAADLAAQCHRNAEIATRKFAWIQRALLCLYLAVLPWVLALWLLYSAVPQAQS